MARFFGLFLTLLLAVSSFAQNITALNASPSPARAGSTATGTVSISLPAGPEGQGIGLSSNNSVVSVPPSATITAGATSANFPITLQNSGYTKLVGTITASTNILERNFNLTVLPANYSSFVGQTVPTTMSLGQSANVTLQFKNTGATTWDAAHHYKLQSINGVDNTVWGVNRLRLQDLTVAPGQTGTFVGTIIAPNSPGVYGFQWRCVQDDIYDPFGVNSPSVNISVVAGNDNAEFLNETGVPSLVFPGAPFSPVFTFKNTGGSTWTGAAGYALQSRSPYLNTTWGVNSVPVPITVAPQNILSISPACTAPTTPGTYTFAWFMVHGSGFGQLPTAVNITVLPPDSSQFISQTVPTTVNAGATFIPQISFKNTGVTTWTSTSKYWLVTQGSFLNSTWGINRCPLPGGAAVARGVTANFLPHLTAPLTPGTYFFQWQVSKNDVVFGQRCTGVTIQVNGVANAEDAQYISSTVPVVATAGQHYIAQVTFKNIGTANWPLNTAVGIYPQPDNSWALSYLKTKSVISVGNSTTYTLDLLAPYVAGNHNIQFRMRDLNTNTWFGQTSPIVTVNAMASVYADSPWPGINGGRYRNTGRAYSSGAVGTMAWSFATPRFIRTGAAIGADGTVYIGCDDGFFYALNGATGALKWKTSLGSMILCTPAIGNDGTVYIGTENDNVGTLGKVVALDGNTGAIKWQHVVTSGSPADGIVLVPDGTLYLTTIFHVLALDSATGNQKWESPIGTSECTPVIAQDGSILITDNYPRLRALNPATGALVWSVNLGASGNARQGSTPVVGIDGTIYVNAGGDAYAIDPNTHAVKWDFVMPNLTIRGMALSADGTLYLGGFQDNHVYAIDAATGIQKWSYATDSYFWCTPAIGSDGTVYIASYIGTLYAFNGETGALKFSLPLGGGVVASFPAIGADGTIYIGDTGNHVHAIK